MGKHSRSDMSRWWQTPLGRHLCAEERRCMSALGKHFYGFFQLQVGGSEALLPQSPRPACQTLLSAAGDLRALPETLPFKCHSIDNMLLLHVLENSPDPHQVLREAERVLAADGTLVLCSFTPLSLWGLRRLFSWQDQAPWNGRFYSQTRLRDWLALLNFEVCEQHRLLYRPPFGKLRWLEAFSFADRWGRRLWPWFGGVSVLVATKRSIPLTPLRQRWRQRHLFPAGPLVNRPITRNKMNG